MDSSRAETAVAGLPGALREHRTRHHLSQLDLALRAGTTQRHLSFIESGRSVPGRTMVVRLGESLELSPRDLNELLLSAGYAPVLPESSLDGPELAPVRSAIDHLLRGHMPYPALVVDRAGTLIAANPAVGLITEGAAPELVGPGTNVYRLALHPDGLAPRVRNLAEWARHILARLGHQADLRAELAAYVPEPGPSAGVLGFAVPLRLRSRFGDLCLMTTVTTFATAVDVTLSELKLEAFLPADAATAEALSAAAAETAAAQAAAETAAATSVEAGGGAVTEVSRGRREPGRR